MTQPFIRFNTVTFAYDSAADPILCDVTLHIPVGWTGVVGANGSGKSTLLKLAAGLLESGGGSIDRPPAALYCPQQTDALPVELPDLLLADDHEAWAVKSRLHLETDWPDRWPTLSSGEQKRAQLAVAFWRWPQLLAIDEPTNHVDGETRRLIVGLLQEYDGVGLLVSHDRELLDALCTHCLFVGGADALVRPGGYSQASRDVAEEKQALARAYELRRTAQKKLEREAARRRDLALAADKKRSKRGLSRRDHDGRAKIDQARLTGRDGVAGKLQRQLAGRLEQARSRTAAIAVRKEYELGIRLPADRSRRNFLLSMPPGSIDLGGGKRLFHPELFIRAADRVSFTGRNGSGKSTLIRRIIGELNVPEENLTYVPQEIAVETARQFLVEARELPGDRLGQLMTVVSRLGSRPQMLLASGSPSPGEVRKLLLALGMLRLPHIIVMDEPTNHMDLPSIECLEEALADCPCALLLVSHDRRFLEKLTTVEWRIEPSPAPGGKFPEFSTSRTFMLRVS